MNIYVMFRTCLFFILRVSKNRSLFYLVLLLVLILEIIFSRLFLFFILILFCFFSCYVRVLFFFMPGRGVDPDGW